MSLAWFHFYYSVLLHAPNQTLPVSLSSVAGVASIISCATRITGEYWYYRWLCRGYSAVQTDLKALQIDILHPTSLQ